MLFHHHHLLLLRLPVQSLPHLATDAGWAVSEIEATLQLAIVQVCLSVIALPVKHQYLNHHHRHVKSHVRCADDEAISSFADMLSVANSVDRCVSMPLLLRASSTDVLSSVEYSKSLPDLR